MSSLYSPPSESQRLYDVFFSFSEEDSYLRANFVSHLSTALSNAGLNTMTHGKLRYRLDPTLEEKLKQAIKGTRIFLVVFSENYAESFQCLDGLAKFMDCCEIDDEKVVVPIFYNVDPWDVHEQTGAFGKALDKLAEDRFKGGAVVDFLLRTGKALKHASHFIGWDVRDWRGKEAELVKKIVSDLCERSDHTWLSKLCRKGKEEVAIRWCEGH